MANSNSDSPVVVHDRNETIVGQPQSAARDPHDGSTVVREIVVHTDRVILDPNSEEAVQVPEGVGASTVGEVPALGSALSEGTAEEQFSRSDKDSKSSASKSKSS